MRQVAMRTEKTNGIRIPLVGLEDFCRRVFEKLGMKPQSAKDSASVLVSADARGIPSHGVARMARYVGGLTTGVMLPDVEAEVVYKTPVSMSVDAHGGIGMSIGKDVMRSVIRMASDAGFSIASVRDSNHFGIAGYYAMMALEHDMIGVCMTNTAALGIPTFGRQAMFGTNPIAVAVPAMKQPPFVLDMSTTVVTRGKVETCLREGKPMPHGWAVEKGGLDTTDAVTLLQDMLVQAGGGILPLGGRGELFGGHKGYGLAVLVDILTAVASGGVFGRDVIDSEKTSARVCHVFAAMRLDLLRNPVDFKNDMDRMLLSLVSSSPAEGSDRVLYAGLKEYEAQQEAIQHGVFVSNACWDVLRTVSKEVGEPLPVL